MTARFWSGRLLALMWRTLAILLVLAFVLAALPRPAQAACAFKYTVQSGDTLYRIASTYQVDFDELVEVNKLKAPYLIYVGQVLCIPPGAVKPTGTPAPTGAAATSAAAASQKLPTVTAQYLGMVSWISLTNFPKNRFVYIKVYKGSVYYWSNPGYQLGIVSTDSKGQYAAYFHMPIPDEKVITVCAKDALNDDVLDCTIVYNEDYYLNRGLLK